MFSLVAALAVLGVTLILAQKGSEGAQKRTESEFVPVRVRAQRPVIERPLVARRRVR
jgi:hypothetical protein